MHARKLGRFPTFSSDNLIPGSSFGHNLHFKCLNGSCEPISDICIPWAFQWYKELFNPMGFDPCNRSLKGLGVHEDSNSQSGSSLGSVRVHSFTISYTSKNMRCDSWASLLVHTLASLCFSREPKARVATHDFSLKIKTRKDTRFIYSLWQKNFCSQWLESKGKFKDWSKMSFVQSKHIKTHFTHILGMWESTKSLIMDAHIFASIEISSQYKKAMERPTHRALSIQQEVVEES